MAAHTLKHCILTAFFLGLLAASPSSAQTPTTPDGGPDPNAVRIRIGPLWLNPTVAMPAIGIDTNVFNDPESRGPKKDFAIVVSPRSDVWLRMGRTWLIGFVAEDVVWYQTYSSEGSVNGTYSVGWRAPLNRLIV